MFLHPPCFLSPASRALIESQKEREGETERETWENKREQSWRGTGGEKGRQERGSKAEGKVRKEIPSGEGWRDTNPDSSTKQTSREREDVALGWGWYMRIALIPRVLGVCRLRSVRLSKHKADCNAPLWSNGHRADSQLHQHNQQGDPAQFQHWTWV